VLCFKSAAIFCLRFTNYICMYFNRQRYCTPWIIYLLQQLAICSAISTFLFICLDPDFLDHGSRPSLNGSPQNLHGYLPLQQYHVRSIKIVIITCHSVSAHRWQHEWSSSDDILAVCCCRYSRLMSTASVAMSTTALYITAFSQLMHLTL